MLLVAEPILGNDEKAALCDVIDSGWITMGGRVADFEHAFAERHGTTDAIAVSSCTAGLHLIMHGLDLGPGDEVLVPALTFVATVNCILYVGATPVFVDIDSLQSPQMSLRDAEAKCTERTRAIVLVHYAGYLPDRDLWRSFAASRGLLLIEDAAHAAGLEEVGTYGVAAAFSFYGNKNMTTAEGGVVISSDENLRAKVRQARGHGLTSGTFQRVSSRSPLYDMTMLGFNYRLDELRAALGLVQLKMLFRWNMKREALTSLYRSMIGQCCPDIRLPFQGGERSAFHIFPIVLPDDVDRQEIIDQLKGDGIQTTIHYPPAHKLTFYRTRFPTVSLPITEEYAQRELTLPLHPRMEERHVEAVTQALAKAIARKSQGVTYDLRRTPDTAIGASP